MWGLHEVITHKEERPRWKLSPPFCRSSCGPAAWSDTCVGSLPPSCLLCHHAPRKQNLKYVHSTAVIMTWNWRWTQVLCWDCSEWNRTWSSSIRNTYRGEKICCLRSIYKMFTGGCWRPVRPISVRRCAASSWSWICNPSPSVFQHLQHLAKDAVCVHLYLCFSTQGLFIIFTTGSSENVFVQAITNRMIVWSK